MTLGHSPHRAWIEIDHGALRRNLAVLRNLLHGRQVIAVVKANAYGHGAIPVAETLATAGVERLAVATLDEALTLRSAGLELPILVLWGLGQPEAMLAVEAGVEPTVYDLPGIEWLANAAERAGTRVGVHLKVDSGLGRQGADPASAVELAGEIVRRRGLMLAGTFSHLAVAGEDDAYTETQQLRFARVLDAMRSARIDPGLVHLSATGGLLAEATPFGDAVRLGIGLYGMVPDWAGERDLGLEPILSLKALPLRIFDLPAGAGIGYGLRFRAQRPTRIATLGIGYGDGWPRTHGNNGSALLRGRRVPIVGAVSMDGLTVDLGPDDDVTYSDEFVLIGRQEGATITAEAVAAERRTINYEVTTALRERLPRVHLQR